MSPHRYHDLSRAMPWLASVALLLANSASGGDAIFTCRLLNSQQVSTIVGRTMEIESVVDSHEGNSSVCKFKGDRLFAEIRVSKLASETAATNSYRDTLRALSRGAAMTEPLHGVGTDSRLVSNGNNLIVARYGTHVVVVLTSGDRTAVVGLARAVHAKVAAK